MPQHAKILIKELNQHACVVRVDIDGQIHLGRCKGELIIYNKLPGSDENVLKAAVTGWYGANDYELSYLEFQERGGGWV